MTGATERLSIWLADCRRSGFNSSAAMDLLSNAERQRYRQYQNPRKRQQFLATRSLTRLALRYTCDLPLDRCALSAWGRPQLLHSSPFADISLAHCRNTAVCAIAGNGKIGVDIESVTQSRDWLAMAENAFSATEALQLKESPISRGQHFLSCWTLKEAYAKASGTALHEALGQLQVNVGQGGEINVSGAPANRVWSFGLYQFREQLIAFCWQDGSPRPPRFYLLPEFDAKPVAVKPRQLFLVHM